MNVWWRQDPLTEDEERLLESLTSAHRKSTFRDNASTVSVLNAAMGSGDLSKAIVAGIMTLGDNHAPLEQTYRFLSQDNPAKGVAWNLEIGDKIPGWGNSFVKGMYDPFWLGVHEILHARFPRISDKIDAVTNELHARGKHVFPNPSAYTAATAIVLGLPAKLAVYLFIGARLDAWSHLAAEKMSILKGEVNLSVTEP